MKKILGVLAIILIILGNITVFSMDNGFNEKAECNSIGRMTAYEDPVTCTTFHYDDPGFQCPMGLHRFCYGYYCTYARSRVAIVTQACECVH